MYLASDPDEAAGAVIALSMLLAVGLFFYKVFKAKPKEVSNWAAKKNDNQESPNDKYRLKYQRTFRGNFELHKRSQRNFPISIGSIVTLWNKPGTNYWHVYHEDSISGSGYLGKFKDRYLVELFPPESYTLKARVNDVYDAIDKWDEDRVFIGKGLIVSKKAERKK